MNAPHCFRASFNGRHVAIECGTDWLAIELQRRLGHIAISPFSANPAILRITLDELEVSWIEVRDSSGRCQRGSFEYASYHVRKWMTAAFVAADPDLTWLHAAAASVDGHAILLAGPAGAGKSTLLVHLIDRAWHLLADDVVALRAECGEALPLPFSPEIRVATTGPVRDWPEFLEQPKTLATIAANRVATKSASVAAVVFPEYARDLARPVLKPLTVVSATQALATQALGARGGGGNIGGLFHLAQRIPCYRLRYADPSAAADRLSCDLPPLSRSVRL